jgi:CRP-like cAMP-binding protein
MASLGIINSDPELKALITTAFAANSDHNYTLKFLSQENEILEFLHYDLPEIVIINFSDSYIDIEKILVHINDDKWSLNFGIVGVYSSEIYNEEYFLKKYKDNNIITMLDYFRIRSHLVKSVQIIEENYQIIFQRGCINPDSKMHLQLALDELLVNAIEHGNCKISYDDKTAALGNGLSVVDLVEEKCKNPVIRAKKVLIHWEIEKDKTTFKIRDEGDGFDVKAHLKKIQEQDELESHGRGIRIAAMFGHKIRYNSKGNEVNLIINHDLSVEQEVPLGFKDEQAVIVHKGDIVLTENDPSDFLYYIASGEYAVLHNGSPVGKLSSQDIFMGEMSFLLNQKRSASIRAETTGKLIRITRKTFIQVIREYPHYGIFLSKLLAKRLVRSNALNAELTSKLNT